MTKRRAIVKKPLVTDEGHHFHVSQDRKVYRLSRHGHRRVKGPEAIEILDQYDRQLAAAAAMNVELEKRAEAPEWA